MGLEVRYKGVKIGQLDEDGNLTLETAGKLCEGNIELSYTGGQQGEPGEEITVEALDATENRTYTAPTGKAYSPVRVNVTPDLEELDANANGTYTSSKDGYSRVRVNVQGSSQIHLQEKIATANGDVTPDNGYDGLSKVTVNVQSAQSQFPVIYTNYTSLPSAALGHESDYCVVQPILPDSVNYLSYIESSGNAYIRTPYKGGNNKQMHLSFALLPGYSSGAIAGAYDEDENDPDIHTNAFGLFFTDYSKVRKVYYDTGYDVDNIYRNTQYEMDIDDLCLGYDSSNPPYFETTDKIVLFGAGCNGAVDYGRVRIYRMTLREDGAVIADFLPAKDENDVVCMYEAITGLYFYNSGGGYFSPGSAIATPAGAITVYKKINGGWRAQKRIHSL